MARRKRTSATTETVDTEAASRAWEQYRRWAGVSWMSFDPPLSEAHPYRVALVQVSREADRLEAARLTVLERIEELRGFLAARGEHPFGPGPGNAEYVEAAQRGEAWMPPPWRHPTYLELADAYAGRGPT